MKRPLRLGLFAATILVCVTASAQSQITGSVTTTAEVSGDASSTHHAIDVVTTVSSGWTTTTRQWGLSGVAWAEAWDQPCWFLLYRASLDGGHQDLAGTVWDVPGCAKTTAGSYKDVVSGETNLFVSSVKICTTDKSGTKDNKLKGIELQFVKVTDGVVSAVVKTRHEQRSNCSWWRNRVSCPSQQIAVGMDFQYGDKGVMGIKLRCSRVEDV
ncbi:MAG: hypothetical protein ABI193_06100 [Minicystis sp.]